MQVHSPERAAMKVVAALIKDSHVIDTYALDVAARDDLADAAKKAFAYFRDRYPSLTSTTNDLMIAFRDDDNAPTKWRLQVYPNVHPHWREGHPER